MLKTPYLIVCALLFLFSATVSCENAKLSRPAVETERDPFRVSLTSCVCFLERN